ncbi:MAG: DUF58 domain-containing protein [Planctomycetes bacterium]|nr:DUF58 domain-containing protein [Planctomycetota bacterium]NOG54525.1 DUF58 domain-containing protein [Planctomycetota bacterium]
MSEPLFDKEFLKKLEYLNLIARRLVFGRNQAMRQSVKKGASIEFKDYRDYTPGDDLRIVDWAAYARTDELYVKVFRQEEELDLWILLDTSGSMHFGTPNKFVYARRVAAALAYIGMCNMDSSSVLPFSHDLQAGRVHDRGRGRIFDLLDFLTDLDANGQTDLQTSTQRFLTRVRRPGLVVLISDFYGLTEAQDALDRLRFFKHQIFLVQVASPWEVDPDVRGDRRFIDVESRAHCDLTVTDTMLRKYHTAFHTMGETLKQYGMKHAIGYALAQTNTPFDVFVRSLLEYGGLLA